jgi:hypothetical protein
VDLPTDAPTRFRTNIVAVRGRPVAMLVAALALWTRVASAGDGADAPPSGAPPTVRWYTLDTPHFHIHFYEDERGFAARAGVVAERAYRLITRYLNW